MITINYNGKTYIPGNGNLFSMDNIIKYAIADGNLQEKAEEVKENKEDVLSVKQENPHDKIKIVTPRGETIHINYDFMPSDTSILEKLREELENKKEKAVDSAKLFKGDWREHYHNGVLSTCNTTLALLTSLENSSKILNSSQFTPGQEEVAQGPHEPCTWNMGNEEATEAIRKSDEYNEKHFPGYKDLKEKNQKESDALFWKPTPGQEIEVSDDGDKWYTSVFKKNEFDGFGCKNDGVWLFARPIEDKIEPLPEFDSNHIEGECVYQDRSVRQISLLTIAVNKLIAKQN